MSGKSQTTVGGYILRRSTTADWYGEIWGRRVYFEKVGANFWHVRVGSKYLKTPIVNVARTFPALEKAVAAVERAILQKRDLEQARRSREATKAKVERLMGKKRKRAKRERKAKVRRERKAKVQAAREHERKVRIIREKGVMRRVNTEWDF